MLNRKLLFLSALLGFLCLTFTTVSATEVEHEEPAVINEPSFTEEQLQQIHDSQQTYAFQTEISRMMKLIINSLYKNKEIFLREAISNASDAIDKIRFLSLTDPNALASNPHLNITVQADADKKTITITDSGIGMTRNDLVQNLGTIAKSGTADFLNALENNSADVGLIGQFGVGFYSVFLVADTVQVISKHEDDVQHIWQSNAIDDFTVSVDPRGNTLGRGTQVILHLKEEASEYLEPSRLKALIRKYSEFINFPIYLWEQKTRYIEVEDDTPEESPEGENFETITLDEEDEISAKIAEERQKVIENAMNEEKAESTEDINEASVEEEEVDKDEVGETPEKKTKSVPEHYYDWTQINTQKPIWLRDPKEVTEEEYHSFYKAFTSDTNDPFTYVHFKAEGELDFRALVFIPKHLPSEFFRDLQEVTKNVKLFVRRVFITDELVDFLPRYLSYAKVLIDSDDLPLNVSRETLQHHKLLKVIRKKVIRKTLEVLQNMSDNSPDQYLEFIKEFGTTMKLGAFDDDQNRTKLLHLLRFISSHNDDLVSLDDYVKRMKKGQKDIYCLTGATLEEIKESPFIEKLLARGYEVLYMTEPVDEYLIQKLPDFEGFRLSNVSKVGVKFGDEDDDSKEELKQLDKKFEPLKSWFVKVLDSVIGKVVVSNRLTNSPCAIAADSFGLGGYMERVMEAQPFKKKNDMMLDFLASQKKVLEINPHHPVIDELLEIVESEKADETTEEVAQVLLETAMLRSGYQLKDIKGFASRIEKIVRSSLGVDLEAQADVLITPAEPKGEETDEASQDQEEQPENVEPDTIQFDDFVDDQVDNDHDEL